VCHIYSKLGVQKALTAMRIAIPLWFDRSVIGSFTFIDHLHFAPVYLPCAQEMMMRKEVLASYLSESAEAFGQCGSSPLMNVHKASVRVHFDTEVTRGAVR
jgi:hypothetical protein